MTTHEFIDEIVQRVPELDVIRRDHLDYWNELLPHLLMADFARWWINGLPRPREPDETSRLRPDVLALLRLLDQRWIAGNQEERDLIGASFVENLWQADDRYDIVRDVLSAVAPNLFRQLVQVE